MIPLLIGEVGGQGLEFLLDLSVIHVEVDQSVRGA